MTQPHSPRCSGCTSFRNDPAYLERAFPGLAIMSSGWGAVRSSDGLCSRHDLYLPSSAACPEFTPIHPALSPVS